VAVVSLVFFLLGKVEGGGAIGASLIHGSGTCDITRSDRRFAQLGSQLGSSVSIALLGVVYQRIATDILCCSPHDTRLFVCNDLCRIPEQ
jgi:hypothetical protein